MSDDSNREYTYHFFSTHDNILAFNGLVDLQTRGVQRSTKAFWISVDTHAWACPSCQTANLLTACKECDSDKFLLRQQGPESIGLICALCLEEKTPFRCSCGKASMVAYGRFLRYNKVPVLTPEEQAAKRKATLYWIIAGAIGIGVLAWLEYR